MFLAVTPIEEFWDKSDELLFLGPWCARRSRQAEWSSLRHRFLPDPWRSLPRFQTAARYCRGVSARLLDRLSVYLNEVLGVSRSRRAWRILLDPWLTYHVEQMYDHWVHVDDALLSCPSPRTLLLEPADHETPRDTTDFMRLAVTDRFHLQMFSSILAARLPGSPVRRLDARASPPAPPAPRRAKALVKRAAAAAVTALCRAGAGEVRVGELGLTRGERLRLIASSGLRALPHLAEPNVAVPPVRDARRHGLGLLQADDGFERLFVSALPVHFPTIFLEGHAEAARRARASLGRTPRTVFTTVDCHYNDSFKFAAAESVDRGSELWGYQHGGSYGTLDYSPAEDFERGICDRYHCWGWSKTDPDPRLRDLPHPMLSREDALAPGDGVLYVSTALDLHNIRLIRSNNGELAADYIRRQARFLNALSTPAREKTLLRLYRRDWGWDHRERVRELAPDARFDDPSRPLSKRLRESRLAVFDCPSTPMLEAFAAGVPSILCWAEDAWPFRPSARPFFEGLREAGVLFESPEEAAAQVGRAYGNPKGWWDEPARLAARRALTATYALSRADWLGSWLKELLQETRA